MFVCGPRPSVTVDDLKDYPISSNKRNLNEYFSGHIPSGLKQGDVFEDKEHFSLGDGEFDFRPTKTQKQVALEGISQVSIHQVHPINRDMFLTENDFQIFQERCTI